MKNLKIINLKAENFKRLVAVDISPSGNVFEVNGKNEQGKTSVLDVIWVAFRGSRAGVEQPIRQGENSCFVEVDLDEIVVRREYKKLGNKRITQKLKLFNKEGFSPMSPQKMLDKLYSSLTFDPLEFVNLKPKEQFEAVKKFTGLDFSDIEKENKFDYLRRTTSNRTARNLQAQYQAIKLDSRTPKEAYNIEELRAKESRITESIKNSETLKQLIDVRSEVLIDKEKGKNILLEKCDSYEDDMNSVEKHFDDKRDHLRKESDRAIELIKEKLANDERECTFDCAIQLKDLLKNHSLRMKSLETTEVEIELIKKEIELSKEKLPDIDKVNLTLSNLRSDIASAKELNFLFSEKKSRDGFKILYEACKTESDRLTKLMDSRVADMKKKTAEAEMPIEGMKIEEGKLYLNEIPFSDISQSQKIRASCAMVMKNDSGLKVALIRHGNDLDADSFKILCDLAIKNDFQLWVEKIDATGEEGVIIDGGLVSESR